MSLRRQHNVALVLLTLTAALTAPQVGRAQEPLAPASSATPAEAAVDAPMVAGESDADAPARRVVSWNEYEGPFSTLRLGGALLYDYAAYDQDEVSKQQVSFSDGSKLRDFRFLLSGRLLKFEERSVTWSAGIMYDGAAERWAWRQTGVMVDLPKGSSQVFIGRSKEGFSLNKVMVGVQGWGHERAPVSDAMIPILADGVKWMGYLPKSGLAWTLGWYGDSYSSEESFSTYEQQQVARVSWLPIRSNIADTVLHLGVSLRDGKPEDRKLRLRARPGSFQAPYVVDTDVFDAQRAHTGGLEAYYRSGPLLLGGEYFVQNVDSDVDRRSDVQRRRGVRGLERHRRDARLQALRCVFLGRVAGAARGPGRAGCDRAGAALLGRGPRCRHAARRPLPAAYADGQLVPVGFHAPRVRLRLRRARSLRPDRHEPLFQRPAPAHAVTMAPPRAGAPPTSSLSRPLPS